MDEFQTPEERDAYRRGKATAEITARLADHDRHLKAINGSTERTFNELHLLREHLYKLREDQHLRDEVAKALQKQIKRTGDRQVTTRTFILGIVVAVLMLAALIISVTANQPRAALPIPHGAVIVSDLSRVR